jgi:hypothetical protein
LKVIKKISKIFGISILIFAFVLTCAFYTHPGFMEENLHNFFPNHFKLESSFSTQNEDCEDYENIAYQLNDRYFDYIWNSAYQKFGDVIKDKEEIRKYYLEKKLILVDSSEFYVVDSLFHSYAFLTPDAKILLDDIGASFKEKLKNTSLKNTRIVVTSLLRTEKTVRKLMKRNRNSVRISSHLHGTTFDLGYLEYVGTKNLSYTEIDYLKDVLAKTLFEFRDKKRCFVTYEMNQACFHVVNRKD